MVKELRWNSLAPQSLQLLVCGIAECQLDDLASALSYQRASNTLSASL